MVSARNLKLYLCMRVHDVTPKWFFAEYNRDFIRELQGIQALIEAMNTHQTNSEVLRFCMTALGLLACKNGLCCSVMPALLNPPQSISLFAQFATRTSFVNRVGSSQL